MRLAANSRNEAFQDEISSSASEVGNTVDGLLDRLQHAFRCHKDKQKLRNMPDYLLRDMGIERSAIEAQGFIASLFDTGSNR